MKTREVVGPEVLSNRMSKVMEENLWFFIKKINDQLKSNVINLDGTIDVIATYHISEDFIARLIDVYKEAGWSEITYKFTEDDIDNNKRGMTIVTFKP